MATEATLTAEEKSQRMDALLNDEEARQKALESELKNMRDILFRKQEELSKAQSQERDLEAVIQVGDGSLWFSTKISIFIVEFTV